MRVDVPLPRLSGPVVPEAHKTRGAKLFQSSRSEIPLLSVRPAGVLFSFWKGLFGLHLPYLRQLRGPGTPCVKVGLLWQVTLRPQVPAELALMGIGPSWSQPEAGWGGHVAQRWFQQPMPGVWGRPAHLIL